MKLALIASFLPAIALAGVKTSFSLPLSPSTGTSPVSQVDSTICHPTNTQVKPSVSTALITLSWISLDPTFNGSLTSIKLPTTSKSFVVTSSLKPTRLTPSSLPISTSDASISTIQPSLNYSSDYYGTSHHTRITATVSLVKPTSGATTKASSNPQSFPVISSSAISSHPASSTLSISRTRASEASDVVSASTVKGTSLTRQTSFITFTLTSYTVTEPSSNPLSTPASSRSLSSSECRTSPISLITRTVYTDLESFPTFGPSKTGTLLIPGVTGTTITDLESFPTFGPTSNAWSCSAYSDNGLSCTLASTLGNTTTAYIGTSHSTITTTRNCHSDSVVGSTLITPTNMPHWPNSTIIPGITSIRASVSARTTSNVVTPRTSSSISTTSIGANASSIITRSSSLVDETTSSVTSQSSLTVIPSSPRHTLTWVTNFLPTRSPASGKTTPSSLNNYTSILHTPSKSMAPMSSIYTSLILTEPYDKP